jgi:hypothetical protein
VAGLLVLLASVPALADDHAYRAGDGARRVGDIPWPAGYRRVAVEEGSFAAFMRRAPLLPAGSVPRRHDGGPAEAPWAAAAVLDMPLHDRNQQCADTALRYWFEYLRESGRGETMMARLTSGDPVRFADWSRRAGESDAARYGRFLSHCFNYVGSYSLSRDLPEVAEADVLPGDLVVQPNPRGGVGHLSIVVDVAASASGARAYLIGYGYLPAQSPILPVPETGRGIAASPWFTMAGFQAQHAALGPRYGFRRFTVAPGAGR